MKNVLYHGLYLAILCLLPTRGPAQSEINWIVNLNTQQITQTDKRILSTLEKDLALFLNGQTWTNDKFETDERIEATIFLTLAEAERSNSGGAEIIPNRYTGTLAIQTSRPIYNTGQVTPVFNYQDKRIAFGYEQFEAIQLSEQSYTSELSSLFAFYAYMILGFDYDTFSPLGGQAFFERAQEIYNQLPSNVANSAGWTASGKTNNRFFLLENVLSPRMLPLRRAYYNYHRLGLDLISSDPVAARNNITLSIEDAQLANQNYPSTAYVQAFVDAKREEIIDIYKGATGAEQNAVITAMSRIDPSQSGQYRTIRFTPPARRRPTTSRGPVGRQ